MNIISYLDRLSAQGRYHFTTDEVVVALGQLAPRFAPGRTRLAS